MERVCDSIRTISITIHFQIESEDVTDDGGLALRIHNETVVMVDQLVQFFG